MAGEESAEYGFGAYSVTEIAHTLIPMRDGVHLAARLWIPDLLNPTFSPQFAQFNTNKHAKLTIKTEHGGPNKDETFGAILEYLPYYKDGWTAARDHNRHPWFASHGFVVVRAEIRGTGASEGVLYGECLPQEFKDCVDILNYIAEQPWSNGNVGMFGQSWGGFNGLQMGYLQPPHLKTVISLYATDNRYTDDILYQGGAVIGNGMLSWAAVMFCWNARPPPPKYYKCRAGWVHAWRERLEAGQSGLVSWLEHQDGDDKYWRRGSIDQDWSKVKVPVLYMSGLEDGYKNAAYRMAHRLNEESKVIIGPWVHDWPDVSVAGPRIDYNNICLSWLNHHLKEKDTSPTNPSTWPRLQAFVRDSFKTKDLCTKEDMGRFIQFPKCPDKKSSLKEYSSNFDTSEGSDVAFFFFKDNLLTGNPNGRNTKGAIKLENHALQGHGCGTWLRFGPEYAWVGDQSQSITHSVNFTSEPLKNTLLMVGDSTLFAALSSQTFHRNYIHAKVCDIFEDGTSTLVTRCLVNLCAAQYTSPLPDQNVRVYGLKMNYSAHHFSAGHRVSISLSPTCFPLMWPSGSKEEVHFHPGASYFTYQTVAADYLNTHRVHHPPPPPLLQMRREVLSEAVSTEEYIAEGGVYGVIYRDDSGKERLCKENYTAQEVTTEKYTTDKTVTTGSAVVTKVLTMLFDGVEHDDSAGSDVAVRIETTQSMQGGYETFSTAEKVRVFLDNQLFWEKSWNRTVPRLGDLTV